MNQLRFPFPKRVRELAAAEEDLSTLMGDRPGKSLFHHELGIDRVPLRIAPRAVTEDSPVSRDRLRSRRRREVRATTISTRRLSKTELEQGRVLYPEEEHADVVRPRTRAECAAVPRPCPFVACIHHLYLDVSRQNGSIKLNFPDLEPDELPANGSCALDVADKHGSSLEDVGRLVNLTRERIRQIEMKAFARLASSRSMIALRDVVDGRPCERDQSKRRLPVLHDVPFDAEEFASDALDE